PGSSGTCPGEAECENDWNPQLPDPGGAEFRNPEGEEERSGGGGNKACGGARQQEHSEAELGHGLQRRDDARVGCCYGYELLPDSRRVSVLHVIVDDSLVSRRRVGAFAQVLEKNPDEQRAERQPQYRQRALLVGSRDRLRCLIVQRMPPAPWSGEPSPS